MAGGDLCASRLVRLSAELFNLETIKKAAYRFTDRAAFDFSLDGDIIACEVRFNTPLPSTQADEIERAFRNEVLDQDLRRVIGEETAGVRNAILAHAFSATGLQNDE